MKSNGKIHSHIFEFVFFIILITSGCSQREENVDYISIVKLISDKSTFDGKKVDVFGFLSDSIDYPYKLFISKDFALHYDRGSLIEVFITEKSLKTHIEKNCLGKYVKIIGEVREIANVRYALVVSGIIGSDPNTDNCNMGYTLHP